MHYNLLFNGCSYTQGSELQGKNDDFEYRDKHRYSQIISEKTGKTYANISMGGSSNDRITRETIEWFERGNTCDIAVIQFTTLIRAEYISKYARHPVNFTSSHGVVTQWGTNNKKDHQDTREAYNAYYKIFYNDNIGLYNFYKNLYILEQYFEKNNINHLFFKLDINRISTFKLDIEDCKVRDNDGNVVDFYWQVGCKNRYSYITSIRGQIIDIHDKSNFTKDYSNEGYRFLNGTHPSELGHQRIADYVMNMITDKYNDLL